MRWTIEVQGINVADASTAAGGDLTVRKHDRIVFAAEITERSVDRARVATTFNTKIAPNAIEDYLFFVRSTSLPDDARQQAQQYFVQGHEVNFVDINQWVLMSLATMGHSGRDRFNHHLRSLLGTDDTPRALKVAWNRHVARLTSAD